MSIKDFAEKVIKAEEEAFQRGNFDLLKKLEDPNVVYHMYQLPADLVGHEAHKQDIIRSQQGVSFTKLEFQYLTGEGNLFVLSLKTNARITGENPRSPIPMPVGKNASGSYLVVCRVKNGKVVEGWANGYRTITD
jgi:hypothetical protein